MVRTLPVYPRKQTISEPVATSRLCHEQPHASQRIAALFDHLVSTGEQRWRHGETERLGRLEVDH